MRELMEYNSKVLTEKGYTQEEVNDIIELYRLGDELKESLGLSDKDVYSLLKK